jgi:hypothetical protein
MLSPLNRSLILGGFAVACFTTTAGAQVFSDGFDLYPLGPVEGNATGYGPSWKGWGGGNTFISQVSADQASSPSNSAKLVYGCDTVVEFDEWTGGNPFTAGQWVMTAEVYVPGTFDGRTYYIGLNDYDDPLAYYEWAIQVAFDATVPGSPAVACDCGINGVITAPITVDTWVPCRWEIDFTADWVDFYYAGALVQGYAWSRGVFGSNAYASTKLDALDLYPEFPSSNGTEIYVDNIQISAGGVGSLGLAYCPGDGVAPHTPCPCGNNNNGAMGGCDWGNTSFPEGGVLSAVGTASMAANDAYLTATGIQNNFGVFFGANIQVNGGNGNPLNDGLRCAGNALVRLTSPTIATNHAATTPLSVQTLDTGAVAGATRRYQYWFRTPGGPCATSANLTNGLEIDWLP